jgi:hypothetical protein
MAGFAWMRATIITLPAYQQIDARDPNSLTHP